MTGHGFPFLVCRVDVHLGWILNCLKSWIAHGDTKQRKHMSTLNTTCVECTICAHSRVSSTEKMKMRIWFLCRGCMRCAHHAVEADMRKPQNAHIAIKDCIMMIPVWHIWLRSRTTSWWYQYGTFDVLTLSNITPMLGGFRSTICLPVKKGSPLRYTVTFGARFGTWMKFVKSLTKSYVWKWYWMAYTSQNEHKDITFWSEYCITKTEYTI